MKTVTLTGGAGFIGSNVAKHYLDQGQHVVVYDTLERAGCHENVAWLQKHENAGNLEVLVGDVRTPTRALEKSIQESDVLLHLAGQVAVTSSVADPVTDFETNALGTLNILELIRNAPGRKPTLIFSSTNKVYGAMKDLAIVEEDHQYSYRDLASGICEQRMLDFHSPYGCSNGCADQYVRDYSRMYGLDTVVFRQSCIYGYRQFGIEDQGWLAWFVIAAVLNKPLTIYGDGKQVRDILFIDDLIAAYDQALDNIETTSGQIYNIGGGPQNSISLLDLTRLLKSQVNLELSVSFDDWRPGDQPVYISNITKACNDFGWKPTVDWKTGVRRMTEWVEEHKPVLEKVF
jgi:CDP-paratose 2-epimerase